MLGCLNLGLDLGRGRVTEDSVDRDGLGIMLSAVAGHGASIRPISSGVLPTRGLEAIP